MAPLAQKDTESYVGKAAREREENQVSRAQKCRQHWARLSTQGPRIHN